MLATEMKVMSKWVCITHIYTFVLGLCRTCEIFGVSELVLGNIKVLEEKEFQSLSVTAEKWITVTEVGSIRCPLYIHLLQATSLCHTCFYLEWLGG